MKTSEAKGTVLQSLRGYVLATFGPAAFEEWLEGLEPASCELLAAEPIPTGWYPLDAGVIAPLEALCRRFYRGEAEGAWQCGRFAAQRMADGIYRNMMETYGSPRLLERADRIGSLFYRPLAFEVKRDKPFAATLDMVGLAVSSLIFEQNVGGFVQRAIELSDNTDVRVRIESRISAGEGRTRYRVSWRPAKTEG